MKKELLALTACILVTALVLGAFTELVSPKRHNYGSDWGEFLQEEENTIDVLFIGSSMTYCNIIPAIFWQETGMTAWDVTGPELTIPGAYHYLVEALKTQSPRTVFIEISGALFSRYTGFTKTVIGQMPWGWNRLEMIFAEGEPENRAGLLFPMFFYHSRWTELNDDDWAVFRNGYDRDMNAGYTYLKQYRVPEGYVTRTDSGADEQNNQRNLNYLKRIAALCREEGITLVFYESPAASTMPEELMGPIRRELAAIDGALVVNFNDYREDIGAKLEGDYYDALHYNAAGAEKFTRFLAAWTAEKLTISPTEGEDEALWSRRLEHILGLLKNEMVPA